MNRTNTIRESVSIALVVLSKFVMQLVYITYCVTSTIYYSIINIIYNRITLDCDVDVRERVHGVDKTKFTKKVRQREDEEDDEDLVGHLMIELNRMGMQTNYNITEDNYYDDPTNNEDEDENENENEIKNEMNGTAIDLYEIIDDVYNRIHYSFEYMRGLFNYTKKKESFIIVTHIRSICYLCMFATVLCVLYELKNQYEQLFYKVTQLQ